MDPLYVVELDVAGESPKLVAASLSAHLARWLDATGQTIDAGSLATDGSRELTVHYPRVVTRRISWSNVGGDEVRALTARVEQDLAGPGDASFITEVTVYEDRDRAALRIEMGRATSAGVLSPAPVQALRRPGLLGTLLRDDGLVCSVAGQQVDGRYVRLDEHGGALLVELLDRRERLPVLLVDAAHSDANAFALWCARELAGMASVFVVTPGGRAAVAEFLDSVDAGLPVRGARLIWPDLGARHPDFDADQLRTPAGAGSPPWTLRRLVRLIAPLSVAARSANVLARDAARAARTRREADLRAAVATARERDDQAEVVELLLAENEKLTADLSFWESAASDAEERADALKSELARQRYRSEAATAERAAASSPAGPAWDTAPVLDSDDLSPLAEFLQTAGGGAVVFTPAAVKSWSKTPYPFPDAMREALLALSQAAAQWRDADCSTGGSALDDWFKTQYELNFSRTDKGLVKVKKDVFSFEGQSFSREPHLQLDQHTSPDRVGRVYFALDTDGRRFVVDHVGVKLYGL